LHARGLPHFSAPWSSDAPGASGLRFSRGKLGCLTACTEIATETAAGALRFVRGGGRPRVHAHLEPVVGDDGHWESGEVFPVGPEEQVNS
jgi:hypothetical protein